MASKTSAVNVQVNSEDKEQATNILSDFGMSMSTFINLAIKQLIKHEKIPFEISNPRPNQILLNALLESEEIEDKIKRNNDLGFKTVNSMIESILDDEI